MRNRSIHEMRAMCAWRLLVKHVGDCSCDSDLRLTYRELCTKMDGVHYRAATHFLALIQGFCKKKGIPPLQALVVNKRTRLPGSGYQGDVGCYEQDVAKVRSYKWADVTPDFGA